MDSSGAVPHRGLSDYRAFLSIPGARRLLLSAVVTRVPTGMLSLALVLLIHARTGSFAVAGVAVGAFALSNAAAAPVQGALVDRLGQPRVLGFCAGAQGAFLVALVVAAQARMPSVLLVILAALAGTMVPPSMACARALWPEIAPDAATRDAAYALDAIILEAAWILGPLIVVTAVAVASPAAAVLVCVAVTVAGTAMFATSSLSRNWRSGPRRRLRGGAMSSRGLRQMSGSILLTGFWWGSLQVGLPALAVHLGSRQASGVLLALVSAGGVLGGLLYGAHSWQVQMATRYRWLLLLLAVSLSPLIVARSVVAAIPLSLIAGLGLTPMISCQNNLVGSLAPAGAVTEAFTWTAAAMFGGVAIGSAASGSLIDTAGVGAPFAAGCTAVALAALLGLLGRRHLRPSFASKPAECTGLGRTVR